MSTIDDSDHICLISRKDLVLKSVSYACAKSQPSSKFLPRNTGSLRVKAKTRQLAGPRGTLWAYLGKDGRLNGTALFHLYRLFLLRSAFRLCTVTNPQRMTTVRIMKASGMDQVIYYKYILLPVKAVGLLLTKDCGPYLVPPWKFRPRSESDTVPLDHLCRMR